MASATWLNSMFSSNTPEGGQIGAPVLNVTKWTSLTGAAITLLISVFQGKGPFPNLNSGQEVVLAVAGLAFVLGVVSMDMLARAWTEAAKARADAATKASTAQAEATTKAAATQAQVTLLPKGLGVLYQNKPHVAWAVRTASGAGNAEFLVTLSNGTGGCWASAEKIESRATRPQALASPPTPGE